MKSTGLPTSRIMRMHQWKTFSAGYGIGKEALRVGASFLLSKMLFTSGYRALSVISCVFASYPMMHTYIQRWTRGVNICRFALFAICTFALEIYLRVDSARQLRIILAFLTIAYHLRILLSKNALCGAITESQSYLSSIRKNWSPHIVHIKEAFYVFERFRASPENIIALTHVAEFFLQRR